MNRLNLLVTRLYADSRLVWVLTLLAMMALAVAAGAPESGGCPGIPSC